MGILCSVGFFVPAVSNTGVCFGMPTAFTAAEKWDRTICCVVVRAVLMT